MMDMVRVEERQPSVARDLNNLAALLKSMGRSDEEVGEIVKDLTAGMELQKQRVSQGDGSHHSMTPSPRNEEGHRD